MENGRKRERRKIKKRDGVKDLNQTYRQAEKQTDRKKHLQKQREIHIHTERKDRKRHREIVRKKTTYRVIENA